MGERISVADVKISIEKAFEGWLSSLTEEELEDPENPGEEAQELNAAHAQVMAFIKGVEAERKQAVTCKAALEACVEVMDANGDYTRGSEAYTQALMALGRERGEG